MRCGGGTGTEGKERRTGQQADTSAQQLRRTPGGRVCTVYGERTQRRAHPASCAFPPLLYVFWEARRPGWAAVGSVGGGSPGPVRLNDAGGCAAVRVVGWQPRPKMQLLVIALLGLVAAPGASAQLGMAGKPSYMLPSAGFFDNWLILFEQVCC